MDKEPSPQEVAFQHLNSDRDSGPDAQHHSLGIGSTQATPGNHIHDGFTSAQLKIGTVTGAKAGNAALTSLLSLLAARGIIIDAST